MAAPKNINLKVPLPRKLKWGVAGCGSFLENVFLPSLQLVKRSRLVSVYSHDRNRAHEIASRFGAPNFYDDYQAFLNSDIDAVYISSKNNDHYYQVIEAAKAGKHVFCERPIALNSAQAEEMVRICKENNVQFAINHIHRFHPLIIKVKELIDKNILGKLVVINASYHIDMPPADNFRFKKELSGGGVLRDTGAIVIDLMRYFGGEVSEVKGFMDNVIYKSEVDDFAAAIIKFINGGYGLFNVSYDTKKPFIRLDIVGLNGSINIESKIDKRNFITKITIDLKGETKMVFRKKFNKIAFVIRSVQKSFLQNKNPVVSGEDGLNNIRLIEMIES
ncbi:Gfo/Idh/MocA family protein [Melioribacter sp. Ez-97]|uniref:Gfo/Idh/MocA family protein n=1 Tax=Melioribacter sp. Ez-97 TaxID=3423434 RepID=UPI003EDB46CA